MPERPSIVAAMAALEAQRDVLGGAVVDVAIAALREKLAALEAPAAEQKLRQVTVLFADIVGSTALSQRLDPEEIHAVMDGALARFTAIVAQHRGRVMGYAGDSMLAVWGAAAAMEDDAENAVRAALAVLEEGRRQGAEVLARHNHAGFDVRVGISTGPVLLGGGVDAEGTVRGQTVNVAARMEQTAPPGTVRITHDTHVHVRGLFDVTAEPPIMVKGVDAPIRSYLVLRAKPRAFRATGRGIEGIETRMIGREAELDQLTQALDETGATRTLRMVTVLADAGLGKSRLLFEFERALEQRGAAVQMLRGRAQRHGMAQPYGVIRDLLAWTCGILESDSAEAARAKLATGFGAVFDERAPEQTALVGHLIGLDYASSPHIAGILQDSRQIRARAFHALAQFLRIGSARNAAPMVVLLDDLHWADDGSLDCIEHIARTCHDLPLLLACFARPALVERRAHWGEAGGQHRRLDLTPLTAADSRHLVDRLLSRMDDAPAALRNLIVGSAEGNPFHMEELAAMLIDDGVIVVAPEGWRVDAARLGRAKVPPTLVGVLQARLDALPAPEKLALQQDSVIGHVFWDEAVREIAPEAAASLDPLQRRELIEGRADSAFAGTSEFAFKHHLLHQVTYETVLKRHKREFHRRTADWLVARSGDRVSEYLGLIADHYERAGEADKAIDFLHRAARAARSTSVFDVALDYVRRALALAPDTDWRRRAELVNTQIALLNSTGRRREQAASVEALQRLAELLDDDRIRAKAASSRSLLLVVAGDYAGVLAAADEVERLAAAVGEPELAHDAMADRATALARMGDGAAAERCLQGLLQLARAGGLRRLECVVLNRLGSLATDRQDVMGAQSCTGAALEVARAIGNRRFEGGLIGNLGTQFIALGEHEKARAMVQSSLDIARAIGDRGSEPYALWGLSVVAEELGEAEAALAYALEARAIAREVGDANIELQSQRIAGVAYAALGNVAEARACFDAYVTWLERTATATGQPPLLANIPCLLVQERRIDEALQAVAPMLAWIDADPDFDDAKEAFALFCCHRVLAAAGAPRADEFLARAHAGLMRRARALPESTRASFLENVRLHREIVNAWNSHCVGPTLAP